MSEDRKWHKSRCGPIYRCQHGTVKRVRCSSGSAATYQAEIPGRILGQYATMERAKRAVLAARNKKAEEGGTEG